MISYSERHDFLCRLLGRCVEFKSGTELQFNCIFCNHHKPKLAININTFKWHCWVCGRKGVDLVRIIYKSGKTWAFDEYRAKFCNITEFGVDHSRDEFSDVPRHVTLPHEYYPICSSSNLAMLPALNYLGGRGITNDQIVFFKMGYCIGGDYDRCIIIPSFGRNGDLNYFVGRSVDKNAKTKYKNLEAESCEIVFNEINVNWNKRLVLVEGPFDLISVSRVYENCTCLLGNAGNIENTMLFSRMLMNKTEVVLALDSDMASEGYDIDVAKKIMSYDIPVYFIDLCGNKDIGEVDEYCANTILNEPERVTEKSLLKRKIKLI